MHREQLLDFGVIELVAVVEVQDLNGLLLRDETAFDPKSFLGDLLATHVPVLLTESLVVFLVQVGEHFLVPDLLRCQFSGSFLRRSVLLQLSRRHVGCVAILDCHLSDVVVVIFLVNIIHLLRLKALELRLFSTGGLGHWLTREGEPRLLPFLLNLL